MATARWLLLGMLLVAGPGAAADLREFAGTVASVGPAQLTVENRMGDRQRFAGGKGTQVSGARSSWAEIRPGDSVIVSWSLEDRPARAHRVRVRAGR